MVQSAVEWSSVYSFRFTVLIISVLIATSSCSSEWRDPLPVSQEEFLAEHEDWRSNREQALVTPPAVQFFGLVCLTCRKVKQHLARTQRSLLFCLQKILRP